MHVDAIVVGAGQAGPPLALHLAREGREVLLVERARVGGTCINYGCTPTKTLVASARAAHVARSARRLGIEVQGVSVDFPAVIARKDGVVRQWREGLERRLTSAERLRLVSGHARFVGEREIEVAGERHRGEIVVLDVGARAATPPLEGLASLPWLDNHGVMELKELPAHLVILGGGYVGCEFAQMFRRFGSAVTVVESGPHLLDREDPDVSQEVEAVFRAEGIALQLGARAARAFGRPGGGVGLALEEGPEIVGSHLLVAVGRRPNTDDLGCDAAGVRLDGKGFIPVDDHYRTSAPGVYAVGDVTGGPQFTHATWDDHRLLLDVLEGRPTRGRSSRIIPNVVFTDPQVARVGLDERGARERGVRHEVARMPFGEIARAIETGETAGLMKVIVDPDTERVLGASLVGAEAGELLHVFVALMQAGAPARAVVDAEFTHPTFAEGLQSLVMKLPRYAQR